jgi:Flp pilus assembly protein TadD
MRAGLLYHRRLSDAERAVELYRGVLERSPRHYGASYQLAVALWTAGRKEEARAAWRKFAALAKAAGDEKSLAGAPAGLTRDDGD